MPLLLVAAPLAVGVGVGVGVGAWPGELLACTRWLLARGRDWCRRRVAAWQSFETKVYRDYTSFSGLPTGSTYLTRDKNGNLLTTEYGLCEYADSQTLHLQEAPENSEVGQLPRSVDVIITNDLADKVKPGDRVQVVGVYKPLGSGNETSGMFRTVIIGVSVKSLAKELLQANYNLADIHNFRKIAAQKDHFEKLAASLAPSICGHDFVKKGLLLLLAGGQEKNLANGTHLRGDINMLLVGDPSVAKSQMLRYIMNVAPMAVSTTGRGSSGVGLTAAVTQDQETGERKLEAGAMVLADRGVVCIDEFDKMSDEDRVAIHEVMEQQTVTIAKAGIHTSLNARCSVVAAANPVYGSYNRAKKATENIGLPDSLLSRFDLLFILLDHVEESHDKRISDHVLRVHRFRGIEEADALADDDVVPAEHESLEATTMYDKFDKYLHGSKQSASKVYSQHFIKKFLRYVSKIRPKISDESSERISTMYMELRGSNDVAAGATPITPRTLETIIRLSCAHAKLRLSALVELQDVEEAYAVMRFAILNESSQPKHAKQDDMDEDDADDEGAAGPRSDGDDDEDDDDDDEGQGGSRPKSSSSNKRPRTRDAVQDEDGEEDGDKDGAKKSRREGGANGQKVRKASGASGGAAAAAAAGKANAGPSVDPNSARFAQVEKALAKAFDGLLLSTPLLQACLARMIPQRTPRRLDGAVRASECFSCIGTRRVCLCRVRRLGTGQVACVGSQLAVGGRRSAVGVAAARALASYCSTAIIYLTRSYLTRM